MALNAADVDPEEMVQSPRGPVTLRTAVIEAMALTADERARSIFMFNRDPGKSPKFFDMRDIEELAKRPDFQREA
jgi:hypothetical protein